MWSTFIIHGFYWLPSSSSFLMMHLWIKSWRIKIIFFSCGTFSSKCRRHLSRGGFSFWAILNLHMAERSHILSLHRWTCQTPGCPLCKLHPRPSIGVRHQFSGQIRAMLPKCALEEQRDCGSIAVLPGALTVTHIQTTKNNLAGHAPTDINNWKVSWSYQVYFKETRANRWFLARICSEIHLPTALWFLAETLPELCPIISHVQFIFP